MRRTIEFLTILSACCVSAFVIVPNTHKPSAMALFAQDSRRGFLEASTLVASGILWQGNSPAIAAVDDLSMPTEGEQEAQRVRLSFVVARIHRQESSVLRVDCGKALRFTSAWALFHSPTHFY
jgi:hypothetical protein